MNVDWFLSTQGRITRIVVGSLLIIIGLGIIGGIFGVVLLLIGAVPIASAAYGTFLLAPFFGRGIRGERDGGAPADAAPADEASESEEDEGDDDASDDAPRDDDAPREKPSRDEADGDDEDDRPALSGDDKPTGARPVRAERPPGQAPRTKDLRGGESGSGDSG